MLTVVVNSKKRGVLKTKQIFQKTYIFQDYPYWVMLMIIHCYGVKSLLIDVIINFQYCAD